MFRHINGVHDGQESEPVAIIGLSGRFPGAENIREYWQLLCNGVDAITEVPAHRWDIRQLYDPDVAAPGKTNTRWGGFLHQVDGFDPLFFGISPREAVQMDPQQRLMLELAWEALADAGQDTDTLRESDTAVFFGASWADYATLHHKNNLEYIAQHTATGTHFSIIANRVSYVFGFRGPSMTIDTACSSSLVAIHQACVSLRGGECSLALAGGVHLMLAPDSTLMMSKFGGLSPDGRCRTFDARANGFVRGEGGGVVVLKMLSQALADKDPIYCVIQGSAVNNDGRETGLSAMQRIVTAARTIRHKRREARQVNTGLTVPNTAAQEAVLRTACHRAGLRPDQVQFVEAHGTGTPLGDPIEAQALSSVYGFGREEARPLLIGSVKTNIGHLEAAAGVAGLIKVALAIKEGLIPANLHFEQPNPNIPFSTLKLKVQTTPTAWPDPTTPPVAGISSFGFGGTNCHILLAGLAANSVSGGAETIPSELAPSPMLLPLSARTAEARQEMAQTLLPFLQARPDLSLADVCYTASLRATHHPYRLAVAFSGRTELIDRLQAFVCGEEMAGLVTGETTYIPLPPPVFVFSGQGPQWWAMGRELYAREPVYRTVIEQCDCLLRAHVDWSLIDELLAGQAHSRMAETAVAQPALFAVQIALAALWQSWGIQPGAVVGHSVGEVAAAYIAGSLTLEQAIQIIFHRGRLMQAASGLGKMAAVDLSADEARGLLNGYADRLAIAAVNGPAAITLAGDADALEQFLSRLDEEGVFYRRLTVDYAFHSHQMAPFQTELERVLAGLSPQTAVIPIFSTVTGQAVSGLELDAAYWGRNLRQTVCFDEAINTLIEQGWSTFIEISPHPVLSGYIDQRLTANEKPGYVLPTLRRKQPETETMLASLGTLYSLGYTVQWSSFYPSGGQVVHLPPYPWQRERYWLESSHGRVTSAPAPYADDTEVYPWLGCRLRSPLLGRAVVFETALDLLSHPFLDDHRLYGEVVAPGAHHISMILSAVRAYLGIDACHLADITFTHALTLSAEAERVVQVILGPDSAEKFTFEVHSRPATGPDEWQLHASGQLTVGTAVPISIVSPPDRQNIQSRCPEKLSGEDFYKAFTAAGYHLGPRFQWLQQIWRCDGEAMCQIRLPRSADQAELFQLPPGLIDSLFQFLCTTLPQGGVEHILRTGDIYIPLGIDGFRFDGRILDALWCHARLQTPDNNNDQTFTGDITLFAESGQSVAEVTGLHFKRAPREVLLREANTAPTSWLYQVQWQTEPVKTSPKQAQANWLILSADHTAVQALNTSLAAQGQSCFMATPGSNFQATGTRQWQLNPAQPDDFTQLVAMTEGEKLDHVIYLWGWENMSADTLTEIEAAQNLAGQGLLHLVQALAHLESEHTPRLWIVTQGAQPVTAEDRRMTLASAPLWGLGRVIALEHPEIWGGLIDLEAGQTDLTVILPHILAADGEDQTAFRQGQRYVARLVRAQSSPREMPDIAIRHDGTYLITGGLGGLGLTLAHWLAEKGARQLVLVGRRGANTASQEAITALEGMGTAVTVLAADITQPEQVTAVLQHIRTNMPSLHGIIHAAGVLHDGILLHQEWSRFTQVMAPKVAGAWHLHTQTSQDPLDFFIFFSSISSLIGSAGQGNYAAANAFMDALSHARRLQGLPSLSINWGPWADVGMATALSEGQKQHWLAQGISPIPPAQGVTLLPGVLDQGMAQVGIFPMHWDTFAQQTSLRHNGPFFTELTQGAHRRLEQKTNDALFPPFWQQLAQTPPAKQKELLLSHVQQQAVQVLGIGSARRLDPRRRLFEMGMDSLMAVELQKRLQADLNIRLSKTVVFDYPTVQSLTNYLARQVLHLEMEETPVGRKEDSTDELQAEIAGLSEAEAEALLLAELGG